MSCLLALELTDWERIKVRREMMIMLHHAMFVVTVSSPLSV